MSSTTRMTWGVYAPKLNSLLGHGWFGWLEAPHVQGCRIAFFETRKVAREHAKNVQGSDAGARAVRLRVTIETVDRARKAGP